MTFRISPKPAKNTGGYQQAVYLKRTLEAGGWEAALEQRGATPEHNVLMSAVWAIAFPREGVTKLSYENHEITFDYTFKPTQKMSIEVDGFPISWHIVALKIMLLDDDEEVTSP
jgi:hypothetical protein